MSTVRIALFNHNTGKREDVETEADMVGPFAIHSSRNFEDSWTLTHVPTGYSVINDAPHIQACRFAAMCLLELPIDWSFENPDDVKSWSEEVHKDVKHIRVIASYGGE
jgi:hypothetical protein